MTASTSTSSKNGNRSEWEPVAIKKISVVRNLGATVTVDVSFHLGPVYDQWARHFTESSSSRDVNSGAPELSIEGDPLEYVVTWADGPQSIDIVTQYIDAHAQQANAAFQQATGNP